MRILPLILLFLSSAGSMAQDREVSPLESAVIASSPGEAHYTSAMTWMDSVWFLVDTRVQKTWLPHQKEHLDRALAWAEASGNERQIARARFFQLQRHYFDSEHVEVIRLATDMLERDTFHSIRDKYFAYFYLCYTYEGLGMMARFIELVELKNAFGKEHQLTYHNNHHQHTDIASAYYGMKRYRQARVHYRRGIAVAMEQQDSILIASLLNNIGLSFSRTQEIDSATFYFNKAIELVRQIDFRNSDQFPLSYKQHFINVIHGNLVDIDVEAGKYRESIPAIREQVRTGKAHDEDHIYLGGWHSLAFIYLQLQEPQTALTYLDSALAEIDSLRLPRHRLRNLELRSQVLGFLGRPTEASQLLEESNAITDSLYELELQSSAEVAALMYEAARRERILSEQQVELAEKSNQVNAEQQKQVFLAVGSGVLLLVSLLLFWFFRKTRRDKLIIEQQHEAAQRSLEQKQILLWEVHHRVKNNLQVVSGLLHLQANRVQNPEVKQLMAEGQVRVESMALVHNMLYQSDDIADIPLHDYLKALAERIDESFGSEPKVDLQLETENIRLDLDKAIPLGLVVNELLSNTYKYAFGPKGGRVTIRLEANGQDRYRFFYSDNGKGLPPDYDVKTSRSLGLRLVRMFAEEMDAELEVATTQGLQYQFEFAAKSPTHVT